MSGAENARSPIRGLAALLRTQPVLVTVAAGASTLAAGLAMVPFFVVARMAAAIHRTPPDLGMVRRLALWAAGALLVRYVGVALANMAAHVAAYRILHDLRLRLARVLGGVPLSFFQRHTSGELRKTLLDDVNQIEVFVAHHVPDGVTAAVVPVVVAVLLVQVDWRMALTSVAMMPLAVMAMAVAMRDVGKAHQRWNENQRRMNESLLEYLRGIHVIKTFGLSARRFGDLARSIEDGISWMEGFMRSNGRGFGTFGALIGSTLVVLVPVGSYRHLRGSLSLEDLILFLVLGPQLSMSMMRLMFAWGNTDRIAAANARIQAILETPPMKDSAGAALPADDGIAFQRVGFRYAAEAPQVVDDVTFEAPAGKVTALVGPSGAGKTTLVRLIPRLWDATEGVVTLGGVDVRSMPFDALMDRVAMVFQEVFLFHGTVRENLRLARPSATEEELVSACRAARAHDFVVALPAGYDTMLGERGARLSGGEKQRISIARALLKDAPVLLLDEATAFADPENEARIQEALSRLCEGRTVVVVAHRLSTIAHADHIVVLERGRVVDQGTHEDLLSRSRTYQSLWKSHTESLDWSLGQRPLMEDAKGVA